MRACFLGQNVCALGYGVAMVQTKPLVVISPADPVEEALGTGASSPPSVSENPMIKELRRRLAPLS